MEKQVSTTAGTRFAAEEYLRLERLAETKREYFDGEILPMPGVAREHNLINEPGVRVQESNWPPGPAQFTSAT
jgi:Uma2 family endonuclease